MARRDPVHIRLPTAAVCVVLASCMATGAMQPGTALAVDGSKTLPRVFDPVLVLGSALPDLTGRSPERVRVFAIRKGKAVPIPFQIDARDEDGDLVLDGTPPPIDDNDELLFMAHDAGDRADRKKLPAKADTVVELEITDPLTQDRAWAYVLHFPADTPPPAIAQYVHFDAEQNRARSDYYTVNYHDRGNFFTEFRISPEAGGSGGNLVHRTRMRGAPTFSFLLGKFTLEFTEEDSMMKLSGVKNGPVRATRQVDLSVDLGALFPELPSGRVETHHFQSSFLTPAKVSIPWVVLNLASDFSFVTLTDFRDVADGTKYFDANYPEGLEYEGQPEMILTGDDHDWWVTAGSNGSFLQAFLVPDQWKEWGVVRGTVFVDEEPGAEERPQTAGKHAAGFSLVDVEDIPEAGDYTLRMFTAVLKKPYEPGDEAGPMSMVHHPLEVTVHTLSHPEPLAQQTAE